MITSSHINKLLRRYLGPILRESGFSKVEARKAWGWNDRSISVLEIRAVGSYFSVVTDWPPMSVNVWMGVYYPFIPFDGNQPLPLDDKGRLLPREYHCHTRSHLACTLDQTRFTYQLPNLPERGRTDIWWFERDGSNMTEAVENIALSFVDEGKPWFARYTDLEKTFAEIEAGHDCFVKFHKAACFAKELGLEEKYRQYASLRDQEKARIDATWSTMERGTKARAKRM
jgi:hypothetical protein